MAKYIVAKIKGTIALAGGRAFFVPAGFNSTWRKSHESGYAKRIKSSAS